MLTLAGINRALDRLGSSAFVPRTRPDLGRAERDGPLVPEIVRPSQFADLLRNETSRPPEHRLMLAILEDALRCYQRELNSPGRRSQDLFREAEDWFASHDTSWPFSFVTICDTFDLDPEYIRFALRQWRSRQALERRNLSLTFTLRIGPVSRPRPKREVASCIRP